MKLNRPKPRRVRLVASDPDRQSKSICHTVYETTPGELMDKLKELLGEKPRRQRIAGPRGSAGRRDRRPAPVGLCA